VWVALFHQTIGGTRKGRVCFVVLIGPLVAVDVEGFSDCEGSFGFMGVEVPINMDEPDLNGL